MPSLREWANLIRVLAANGTSQTELPRLLRLSVRAVRSGLADASRKGWVTEAKSATKRSVHLTLAGSKAAARWGPLREAAEVEWRQSVGIDATDKLRSSLDAFVSLLPLELSHYPAGYGIADERITGGNGKDWKPVPREAGDTVSELPISALLSQALVAFAMAYEEKADVALSLSTMVLKALAPEGCSAKEIGNSVGVSALKRHGYVRAIASANGPLLQLTDMGRRIGDAYDDSLREVEADWRARFGDGVVTNLRSALEGVTG